MTLYFGYKKQQTDTEDLEKSISALKTGLATNNSKTKSLESTLFKKDGSIQMTGDLDMGDNAILGVDDIPASNSAVSKKYVDDNLSNKLSAPSNLVTSKITFAGGISMGGKKIEYVDTPTSNFNASNKKYVDDKVSTNSNNITSLASRVTTLETIKKLYTYHFDYLTLDTSWSYPTSNAGSVPYHWMFCKGLNSTSKFHIHTLAYDVDDTLDSNYTFTFKLDFLNQAGSHWIKEFTIRKGDYTIPGERILFINQKITFHGDADVGSNYTNFELARLAIKGSAVKGNEVTVSCSFEI